MRRTALILIICAVAACTSKSEENASSDVDMTTGNAVVSEAPKILCDVIHERVTEEECADLRALREDVRTGAAALNVPNPMTRGKTSEVTLVVDRRPLPEIRAAEQTGADGNAMAADDTNMNATDMNAMDMNAADMNATAPTMNAAAPEPGPPPQAIPPDEPSAETPNQVVEQLPGEDHSFTSRVGRYMKATLVGEGFDIRLISPSDPVQEIAAGGQGTWIWEVKPKEGGPHTLTALTEAVGKVGERSVSLGNGRTAKTITVEVRTVDRIWDFIVAAPDWLKALAVLLGAVTALLTAWFTLGKAWRNRNSAG